MMNLPEVYPYYCQLIMNLWYHRYTDQWPQLQWHTRSSHHIPMTIREVIIQPCNTPGLHPPLGSMKPRYGNGSKLRYQMTHLLWWYFVGNHLFGVSIILSHIHIHPMKYPLIKRKTAHTKHGRFIYLFNPITTPVLRQNLGINQPTNQPRPVTRSCEAMVDPFGRARNAVQGMVKWLDTPEWLIWSY